VREAVVMASILHKCSIPVLHSSVAMLKLAQLPYRGTTCLFLKTLIDKRYSLPYKVIDALCQFFCQFAKDHQKLPVIWHQNLLAFVQRYKNDITTNQRANLKALLRVQVHHLLTPEIRRELLAAEPPASASTSSSSSGGASAASAFSLQASSHGMDDA